MKNKKTKSVTFRIPEGLLNKIKAKALKEDRTLSSVIVRALLKVFS